MMRGFTTLELMNLDVITDRQLQPGNLQNGILPLFDRKNWLTKQPAGWAPFYTLSDWQPLPDGIAGDWLASNDLVWNTIQPSLQIASRILMSSTVLPFVSLTCQVLRLDSWAIGDVG